MAEDDAKILARLGYAEELKRRMSGFSNTAISLSIICILAGGVTSFGVGLSTVGGAAIGVAWPISCALSLAVAATMADVASAFPTAGGLYHWAAILGGRGFGWATAWFNLAGLVTVLAAIDVGAYQFTLGALSPMFGFDPSSLSPARALELQTIVVVAIVASQALVNHVGIRATTALTDFSGWWILFVSVALAALLVAFAPKLDAARLVTFTNMSGEAGGGVWPETTSIPWLFLLGFLLPAYTITGFDASAHTSEETIDAQRNVPRGIVRSVLVSSLFGFALLAIVVSAAPSLDAAAAKGNDAFLFVVNQVLPKRVATAAVVAIAIAQYLCGLATVTSASRMAFAFARDGGLPFSKQLREVSARTKTPAVAIWTVSIVAIAFTIYTPIYSTITAVCVIFLYLSYVIPTAIGLFARDRSWTARGPWTLGRAYKPLALVSVVFSLALVVIGVQPPNDKALTIVVASFAALAIAWIAIERRRFRGPPVTDVLR